MKLLISVVTCRKFNDRADVQRRTWVRDAAKAGVDVRFFVGGDTAPRNDDEVVLPVPDEYDALPFKVREMFRWAELQDYDYILKTDDDTVVFPRNFSRSILEFGDVPNYFGRVLTSEWEYCSGFGYVLSNRAACTVAREQVGDDKVEDRWVGKALRTNDIYPADSDFIRPHGQWTKCRYHARAPETILDICPGCRWYAERAIVLCPMDAPGKVEELYPKLHAVSDQVTLRSARFVTYRMFSIG